MRTLSLAAIQQINPLDVPIGHALPLADLNIGIRDGGDGVHTIVYGEGCSSIVHDGAIVIWSVQVVGVLQVKVEGHVGIDVFPVDPDIVVTVTPGLLVLETQSMHDFMLDDSMVHTAQFVDRKDLSISLFTQRGVTSISILHHDVVMLILPGHEADAGGAVEGLHAIFDGLPLPVFILIANGVRDDHQAVGVFWPQTALGPTLHGISVFRSHQVSFQEDLFAGIVRGKNSGADVNRLIFIHCVASFLFDGFCLREAE